MAMKELCVDLPPGDDLTYTVATCFIVDGACLTRLSVWIQCCIVIKLRLKHGLDFIAEIGRTVVKLMVEMLSGQQR